MLRKEFLDLVIFEKIFEYAKKDSADIKAQLQSAPDRDWTGLIKEKTSENKSISQKIKSIEKLLATDRARLFELKGNLDKLGTADIVTPADIKRVEKLIHDIDASISDNILKLNEKKESLDDLGEKIEKINSVKVKFPINKLRDELIKQSELRES